MKENLIDDIWFVVTSNVLRNNQAIQEVLMDKFVSKLADDYGIFVQVMKQLSENYKCSIYPSLYGDRIETKEYDSYYEALKDGLLQASNLIKLQDNLYNFIANHCKPGQILNSLDYGEVEFVKCEKNVITCKTDDKYLFYTVKGIPCYWSEELNCWRYDDTVKQKLFIKRGL